MTGSGGIVVGVGLSTRATSDEVGVLVAAALAEGGVDRAEVRCLATIDHHQQDPRLTALGWSVDGWGADELAVVATASPSERARLEVGAASVAEAAARLSAGPGARLAVPKRRSAHATVAIAVGDGWPRSPSDRY